MGNWKYVCLTLCMGVAITAKAQTNNRYTVATDSKGVITDRSTNELLTGAEISIPTLKIKQFSALDGSFKLKSIQPGEYRILVKYKGFQSLDTTLQISNGEAIRLSLNPIAENLNEITVFGKRNKESESSAKLAEKNASNVENIVAARAIELSPDLTIANVLQRISGLSVERSSNGDGRYAIIRGMDQRYNYTLINGVKIPSPDNKYRYVPMDLFPSDLVERVIVNKTLTPDMEGDAIGGSINMIMKNAPSKFYFKGSLASGVSQTALDNGYDKFPVSAINKKSPYQLNGPDYVAQPTDFTRDNLNFKHVSAPFNGLGTLAIGNRFFKDRLGVMLGASYQNTYRSYHNLYIPAESPQDNSFIVKHVNVRQYSNHIQRTGANLKLDYNFNPNNKISLYNIYANLKDAQTRLTQDTLMTPPRTDFGTGQVWYYGRSKYQEQSIYNSTLQGDHHLMHNKLYINWSALYSKATNHIPDWAEYEYDGGVFPTAGSSNTTPVVQPNIIQNLSRQWWRNSDRDYAGYLNLHYNSKYNDIPYEISVGGMYRNKHRDNYFDDYSLKPVAVDGSGHQTWDGIYNFQWYVSTPSGSPTDANNYTAQEKISAGYGMLKFWLNKLETVLGLRMEHTDQSFETAIPVTEAGKSGTVSYNDFLPSINLKYKLDDITNVRLAYYAAISRPGFFEIVPYKYQGDDFNEQGNPNLQHTTSHNIDVRYELFPKSNEQLFVGAFFKKINNPIEYGFNFTGQQASTVYQPNNYGNATNYGFEFVYEKYIGNIGIRANYTYTHSNISTTKVDYYTDNGIPTTIYPTQKRPLQGQAAHIANVALIYKNAKSGTDLQVNWQYTSKRITLVSPYYDMDYWQNPMSMFDFSGEQRVASRIYVFAKVQNILNAKYKVYINKTPSNYNNLPFQENNGPWSGIMNSLGISENNKRLLSMMSQYGQNYTLGIRFDLTK